MSTHDMFGRFLELVTQALDEPDVCGETLAARAHLSRFHFDRVVAATAGETPAAFRRRILLERAAYRLVSSRHGVLDIAVEAGYSSHEAFTRAFARAFGSSPTAWRRRPSQPRIEAPSGVHFHPPGGLRVPPARRVSAMDLLQRIVEHHVWLIGEMVDRAARLDDAALDRPIETSIEDLDDGPSIRTQLDRLVAQLERWVASVEGRTSPHPWEIGDMSVGGLRARLATAGPEFVSLVRRLTEEGRLDETFVDATCEPPVVFSYGGMIAHVVTFAAYRRSVVALALYSAGITDLGSGDPREWVAQPH
ncbi:MAG: helix-turn-helix domain-containing protein [Streptosporangiales bacterium]|nr:helix-turn-helix domain-containing protein [Streptosporangiales bacterium]